MILGVIGFYIYDSLSLLFHNQIVFTEASKTWGFTFPSSRFRLGSRFIFLCNVFMPFQSVFLSSWPCVEKAVEIKQLNTLNKFLNTLILFRLLSVILWITLILILPPILLMYGTIYNLLTLLAVTYLIILLMILLLRLLRKKLNLTNKDFVSIAFDILACPPFAINVVRKITLKQKFTFTPIEFSKKRLSQKERLFFKYALSERIEESINSCDDNSKYKKQLILYRQGLMNPYQKGGAN